MTDISDRRGMSEVRVGDRVYVVEQPWDEWVVEAVGLVPPLGTRDGNPGVRIRRIRDQFTTETSSEVLMTWPPATSDS